MAEPTPKKTVTNTNLRQKIMAIKSTKHMPDEAFQDLLREFKATKKEDGSYSLRSLDYFRLWALYHRIQGGQGRPPRAPKPAANQGGWREKYLAKIRVSWGILAQHGVIRDGRESAMRTFALNFHAGIERLEWAKAEHYHAIISRLIHMAEDAGVPVTRDSQGRARMEPPKDAG